MRAKTWTGGMMIAALIAIAAAAVVTGAGARQPAREIALVARGMAFYLAEDPATANPTLTLRAGERVRFVLRNETPGIEHDLAIGSLGLTLSPLVAGQVGASELVVPDVAGSHEYQCRPHAVMMKGTVVVEPAR